MPTPRSVDKTGRMLLVCDCVIYGLDSFGQKPQGWRVRSHYYREEHDTWWAKQQEAVVAEPKTGDEWAAKITCEIVEEDILRTYFTRLASGKPANNRFRYIRCHPHEATHVGLSAICGCIAPINECTFEHVVDWDEKMIKQEQANMVTDFWLKDAMHRRTDWYWE